MNSVEAKERLLLYRPGTDSRDDEEFAEALQLAARDPELGRWFAEHCQLQEALRARFRHISVPEGLQEQILSERRVQISRASKRKSMLVALVALAVLLFAIASLLYGPSTTEEVSFAGFQRRMSALALREYPRMDLETRDMSQIQKFLSERGRNDFVLPTGLTNTSVTGCALLKWQDKPVTMVCFNSGKNANSSAPDVFLFVIARSDVPGAPKDSAPRFVQHSRLASAMWSSGDKAYLLGTFGDSESLRRYL